MSRQDKKAQFESRKTSRLPLLALIVGVLIAGGAASWALLPGGSGGMQTLKVNNGVVQIPQQDLEGGQARFYKVATSTGDISFFLVKSQDGVIRAAFDTCDVCYKEKKGYRQEGNSMICNNCNQAFRTDMINVVKGGCNPAPLQRELRGNDVVIEVAALEQGSPYFN